MKRSGREVQLERAAEVEDAVGVAGRVGGYDPTGCRRAPEDPGRLELGLARARKADQRGRGRRRRRSAPHAVAASLSSCPPCVQPRPQQNSARCPASRCDSGPAGSGRSGSRRFRAGRHGARPRPSEGPRCQRLRARSHQIAEVARLPHDDAVDGALLDMAPAEGRQRNARHPDVVALRCLRAAAAPGTAGEQKPTIALRSGCRSSRASVSRRALSSDSLQARTSARRTSGYSVARRALNPAIHAFWLGAERVEVMAAKRPLAAEDPPDLEARGHAPPTPAWRARS